MSSTNFINPYIIENHAVEEALNVEEVGGRRILAELDELLRIKPNFSPLNFSHTDIRDLVDSLRQHNFEPSQITIRETNVSNLSEKN